MARLGSCNIYGYASPPWNNARESLPRTCYRYLQAFRLVLLVTTVVPLLFELIMLANRQDIFCQKMKRK